MTTTTATRVFVQDVAFAAWGLATYNNCLNMKIVVSFGHEKLRM